VAIKTSLNTKDVEKIISQADNLRDKLIVQFYYDTGIRVSELLQIRMKNIDLEQKTVLIPHLKHGIHKVCPVCNKQGGRKIAFCSKCGSDLSRVEAIGIQERTRLIDIGDDLVTAIKEFIGVDPIDPEAPLIGLTRQSVYNTIRALAAAAGLGGRIMLNPETGQRHYVHPHNFRDSLATDGLEKAKGDANMQKALMIKLGHARFETTLRYDRLTASSTKTFSEDLRNRRKGT
jgi:integrase